MTSSMYNVTLSSWQCQVPGEGWQSWLQRRENHTFGCMWSCAVVIMERKVCGCWKASSQYSYFLIIVIICKICLFNLRFVYRRSVQLGCSFRTIVFSAVMYGISEVTTIFSDHILWVIFLSEYTFFFFSFNVNQPGISDSHSDLNVKCGQAFCFCLRDLLCHTYGILVAAGTCCAEQLTFGVSNRKGSLSTWVPKASGNRSSIGFHRYGTYLLTMVTFSELEQ